MAKHYDKYNASEKGRASRRDYNRRCRESYQLVREISEELDIRKTSAQLVILVRARNIIDPLDEE